MEIEDKPRIFTNKISGRRIQSAIEEPKLEFRLLHEIFEAQADKRPDSAAVISEENVITYGELEIRANRLANYLSAKGVRAGSLVAILLHRSVDAYVAILAVLKAGAAYVPLDPEYPDERIAYIFKDSGCKAFVTTSDLAMRYAAFCGAVIRIDADQKLIGLQSPRRLGREDSGADRDDLCYVIYTSGSTGRPKGVQIEHRSACNLVMAEGAVYHVKHEDRVCQAASLSFDLSVEEIWAAFSAGAALVPASAASAKMGPDFAYFLAKNRITILSCVPTLLAMLEEDLPHLRLVILGGEACPGWLVDRWARHGRRLLNTYGPTETTVIATCADLVPGKPVTIGRAIQGYNVYLLDDRMEPVPEGKVGQICIGGMGVARGYVGREQETRARFVPDPFAASRGNARMYLSGDLGRMDSEGNIEFVGRADSQVKLRGFRIELSEIESVMMQHGSFKAVACAVREDTPGIQQIVGYVIPREGYTVADDLRQHLKGRLPSFMVPSLIEVIDKLPLLPNGKLDRALLPEPRTQNTKTRPVRHPKTKTESKILKVWESLFRPLSVSTDDNFFLDLGGHSLLAARTVSELRKDEQFSRISVADLYANPTIESLAPLFDLAHDKSRKGVQTAHPVGLPQKKHSSLLASMVQTFSLYALFGFRAVEWITPYLVFFFLHAEGYSFVTALAWSVTSSLAVFPSLLAFALAVKWILLGKIRSGRHPLWGGYYLRWWFTQSIVSSIPLDYLAGTPLLPFVYRLFGAKIGKNVHMDSAHICAFDLVSIGDNSSIDNESSLLGCTVEDGMLVLGSVTIGRKCFVGTDSVLREDTVMEDGSRLDDLSLLPRGVRISKGSTWAGSPARPVSYSQERKPDPPVMGAMHRAGLNLLYGMLALVSPVLLLAAIMPGVIFLTGIPITQPLLYLPAVPIVGASFVFFVGIEVVLLKWLVAGRISAGTYPVHGRFYIRNWFVNHMIALALDLIGPLHATLYLVPWYRALGAKIGRFVELSTANTSPDLLEIGDESTVADEVSLGLARVEGGWMTIRKTNLGRRTFLGNSAVVPEGTKMGDETLVGVLSIAPDPAQSKKSKVSWLGSPAILLPKRQSSFPFTDGKTFRPSRKLRLIRGTVEIGRITLPTSGFILVATAVMMAFKWIASFSGLGVAILMLPLTYAACCVAISLLVILAKWIIIGRFKPFARPLWSQFVWRLEFVNSLYEFLATPLILEVLRGTQLLPLYLRLLGVKIGKDTWINTTGFLEFDLVEIGDRAVLNEDCVMQTHLFEDRVLKASKVRIGAGCNVGEKSVALYDSEMEDGSRLDSLSLLMKGERLPANTSWKGIPAKRSDD